MALPPGVRSPAFLQLLRYTAWPTAFLKRGRERYGMPFTIRLPRFGTFVLLSDPVAVRDVFTGDPHVLYSGEGNAFMADTLGPSSLLVLDDEPHARQRRALLPPFHGASMKAHFPAIRAATLARVSSWRPGSEVLLEDECREITLEVILRTIFGMESDAEIADFAPRVRTFMRMAGSPVGLLADSIPIPLRPLFWAPYLRRLRAVTGPLLEQIRARRRAAAADGGHTDVLTQLFGMTHEDGEPLTDHELRDHLFTLLLAGHDTSAVALAWALLDILGDEAVLARVRAELDEVFADGPLRTEESLPYLDAVIKESLRLHPVVPFVVRKLKAPFVAAGVEYPAGVHLSPCMVLAHSDPELYPEPAAFRPERFLDTRVDPYRWFPFGGGTRRCIGLSYALYEMRGVLATLLREVDLTTESRPVAGIRRHGLMLAPKGRGRARVLAKKGPDRAGSPVPA